ncbi:MAG: AsmA-like C-terminal region-containing protein [Pseudomonadota bacterium]
MSEENSDTKPEPVDVGRPKKRGTKRKAALSLVLVLLSVSLVLLVVGLLSVMGRSVPLPDWAVQELETRINAQIEEGQILISDVRVGLLDEAYRPTIKMQGVRLRNATDGGFLTLPSLQVKLDTSELILGRIALETIDIDRAVAVLTRDENGQIQFSFGGQGDGPDFQATSAAEVFQLIDEAFARPEMRELEEINASGVRLVLNDRRAGRGVEIEEGRFELINGANFLALQVAFDLTMDGAQPTSLVLSADKAKGAKGGRVQANFSQLRVRDIAQLVSTLNFLDLLDAPVDGALTTEFGPDGEVVSFRGALDIGTGFVQPAPQAKALPLNSATTEIRYSAATSRLHLEALEIDAPELRIKGRGHADLQDFQAGIPETLLMQLRLTDLKLDPEGIFETPVTFDEGQLDMRYRPNDLTLDIGQMVLREGETEIIAGGNVSVVDAGWRAAVDANIGSIDQDQLLGLWPTSAVKNTRNWLTRNIRSGELFNAAAGLRLRPNAPVDAAVTFNFKEADVVYLKTLPPIQQGDGYVTIAQDGLTLVLHKGHVKAPSGELLDMTGSMLRIPDLNRKIPDAEISLRAEGELTAAMSLLDEKPFQFLSKSELPIDLATGQAQVTAQLGLPLAKDVLVKDISYAVEARLSNVASTKLVEGRNLRAARMDLQAGGGRLSIAGKAQLDDIPLDVTWSREIGPGSADGSTVTGQLELSQATLNAFNIGLPKGSVTGKGLGAFTLNLSKGAEPELSLTSDLQGIGLRIDGLGWSKPRAQAGKLEIALQLAKTPVIKGFSIAAAGLSATGDLTLRPGGGLERAVFSPLRVADRLNSRVELVGRGQGQPVQVLVRGGTIDIRKFGVGSGGAQTGQGQGPPLDLALDSLRVTDGIKIDNFRGKFRNSVGLDGSFAGLINGSGRINGTVVPTQKGLAVRIAAQDGGGVIASTGLFRNARGGEMNLILQPTGRPGEFNGQIKVQNTRIKKAPALADLLSALSVVGLLEQLSGDGILFSEVEANFQLSPGGVKLFNSRAAGPSMGITMDGVYSNASRRMAMQGVISPLYVVNRPLGFLFSREGEGLFGFNYALNGSADAPKVSVNPLSVFTPGIFREMFRAPPPKPAQQVQN